MNFLDSDFTSWMISEDVLLTIAFERRRVVAVSALPGLDAHVRVLQSHVLIQSLLRRHGLPAVGALVSAARSAQFPAAAAAKPRSLQGC